MNIKRIILRIKSEIMYYRAITMADKASAKHDGDVYFVMPTTQGKLTVINHSLFSVYKRQHLTDPDCKVKDLFKDCVYHTNCKSAKGKLARKRKFLRWRGLLR